MHGHAAFRSTAHVIFFLFFSLSIFLLLLYSVTAQDTIARYTHAAQKEIPEASLSDYNVIRVGIHFFFVTGNTTALSGLRERETAHMKDVLFLVRTAGLVWFMCLVAVLWGWLRFRIIEIRSFLGQHARGALAAIVLFFSVAALFFEELFIAFHQVVFVNDLWLLDPAEHVLIRAYPPYFFKVFVASMAATLILFYVALLFFAIKRQEAKTRD